MMDDSSHAPVFVLGSSRSGTTLVYSIVLSSGDFPLYEAETHLLDICPVIYGSVKKESNYKKFVKDWINLKPFLRSGLDSNRFMENLIPNPKSYTDFLKYYMDSIADNQGKLRWAEQTPAHVLHLEEIIETFPDAKIIHVIRDGRDVALSKRKVGWFGTRSKNLLKQLVYAAVDWQISVMAGKKFGEKNRKGYLEIYYEDVIFSIEDTIKKINSFIGTEINSASIANNTFGSLGKGNTAFGEKMKGVSKNAVSRWKKALNKEETLTLNYLLFDTLEECNYPIDVDKKQLASQLRFDFKIRLKTISMLLEIKRIIKEKTIVGRYANIKIPQVNE